MPQYKHNLSKCQGKLGSSVLKSQNFVLFVFFSLRHLFSSHCTEKKTSCKIRIFRHCSTPYYNVAKTFIEQLVPITVFYRSDVRNPVKFFKKYSVSKIVLTFHFLKNCSKGVTYDKRPKMKRETRLKAVLFLGKKTAFSRASLHLQAFVVCCGFTVSLYVSEILQ